MLIVIKKTKIKHNNTNSQNIVSEETNDIKKKKTRDIKNPFVRNIWMIILALLPISGVLYLLSIHEYFQIFIYKEQYVGWFLALMLSGIFLGVPAGNRASREKIPWYDWILAALGFNAGIYMLIFYPQILDSFGQVTLIRYILSIIAVLLILEGIRRVIGKALLIIVGVFLFYGLFSEYFPGILRGSRTSKDILFNYLYLDANSLISLLSIASTIALTFILFGQLLLHFGGGDILNRIAIALFGRFRGGTAKAAVVGSSFVGSITGDSVSNVTLTGSVTIPLMKKNGFSSTQAGAIEAVSSTGGQIMPPIMGIASFIIAETLGIPYSHVAIAALIPAIMFYIALFLQVDFMAGRIGLPRLSKEEIPSFKKAIKAGWVVAPPFLILIYLLFFKGYTPPLAGLYSTLAGFVFLGFQKDFRNKIMRLLIATFINTGKVLLEIGIILSAAGLVLGITGVTGLGFNISLILSEVGAFGLFPLLIICAIASIILGMGMPSVAAYTLVAILVAPSIVEFGVDPLSAHMFVFYFSVISNFTPPVALACFAAAPIAGANPHAIGFKAMGLGIVAYIVPFMFIYSPEILLSAEGQNWSIGYIVSTLIILPALYFLAGSVEGYILQKMGLLKRIFAALLSLGLLFPASIWDLHWIIKTTSFILMILFIYNEWRIKHNHKGPKVMKDAIHS